MTFIGTSDIKEAHMHTLLNLGKLHDNFLLHTNIPPPPPQLLPKAPDSRHCATRDFWGLLEITRDYWKILEITEG